MTSPGGSPRPNLSLVHPEPEMVELAASPSVPPKEVSGVSAQHVALNITEAEEGDDGLQPKPSRSLHRSRSQAALLADISISSQVRVVIENVSAFVPILIQATTPSPEESGPTTSSSWPSKLKDKMLCSSSSSGAAQARKEKQVLFNITACIEPGEVLALMGPSGSGKSSLLSILGGRSTARTEGEMLFGGRKLDKPMKRKLGFVTQVGAG